MPEQESNAILSILLGISPSPLAGLSNSVWCGVFSHFLSVFGTELRTTIYAQSQADKRSNFLPPLSQDA